MNEPKVTKVSCEGVELLGATLGEFYRTRKVLDRRIRERLPERKGNGPMID